MNASLIPNSICWPERIFRWRFWIIAMLCLGIGACVASWSALEKPQLSPGASASTENAAAPGSLTLIPTSGSEVILKGTSTVGEWTSRSADIRGAATLYTDETALDDLFDRIEGSGKNGQGGVNAPLLALPVHGPASALISVPVMSLHGDNIGMDGDMQKALKASEHPLIEFVFAKLQQSVVQYSPRYHQAELKLSLVGNLRLAGAQQSISMDVIIRRDSRHHFIAHAETSMLMSDFGVTPPVALFGLIKGGEKVVVTFDLDLSRSHGSRLIPARSSD
jgi:hypothetical protein